MATKSYKPKYSTNKLASDAIKQLSSSLKDKNGRGMFTNDLDAYVSNQLRKDYKDVIGYDQILKKMNKQSDAAWDLSRAQQIQAMNTAEAQNYADTQNAIMQMRGQLAGSASSGANRGAANATALQALLGLGQQTAQTTTEAMQGYQNASREAAAARAQNAVNALDSAREGMNSMYENATSAYGADHTYGVQGLAESLGSLGAGINTDANSNRMNNATNQTNLDIENTTKRTSNTSTSTNKNYNTDKSTSVNKNYNYNRK